MGSHLVAKVQTRLRSRTGGNLTHAHSLPAIGAYESQAVHACASSKT